MSRSLGCRAWVLALVAGLTFAGAALAQEHWTAPASEKTKKNPLPNDKKVIEQGVEGHPSRPGKIGGALPHRPEQRVGLDEDQRGHRGNE